MFLRNLSLSLSLAAALVAAIPNAALAAGSGKRVEIVLPSGAKGAPKADKVADFLAAGPAAEGDKRNVRVRATKTDQGALSFIIDLWGIAVAPDAADKLREKFPGLSGAQITVSELDAPAPTPEGDADEIKKRVEDQLKADGKEGTVEVKVENEDGKKKVRVEVKQEKK